MVRRAIRVRETPGSSPGSPTMTRAEKIKFITLRSIGNFLVLFALYGVGATFGPALYFEAQFHLDQIKGIKYQVASLEKQSVVEVGNTGLGSSANPIPTPSENLKASNVKILVPKSTQFGVLIPKIGANAPIFANIDPANESEFLPILQKGVAHAKGSVFPGVKGNTYLFAHSTDNFWDIGRYNAIFYLLKDLRTTDDIIVFFQNKRYNYKVVESRIVDAGDVSLLVNSQKQDKEQLILQTCWPPGTAWKRLLVIAEPSSR